jgi:hypothetical protein
MALLPMLVGRAEVSSMIAADSILFSTTYSDRMGWMDRVRLPLGSQDQRYDDGRYPTNTMLLC